MRKTDKRRLKAVEALAAQHLEKMDSPHKAYLKHFTRHMPSSHKLGEKAFSLLSSMKYKRREFRDKGRRIAGRKLPGVLMGNPNIFQHTLKTRVNTSCAITCLMDFSGSMTIDKMVVAACGAAMVAEMCKGFYMPCAIEGFTESEHMTFGCVHYILKKRSSPVETEELLTRFARACQFKNQNADGDSIYYAWNRILQQTTKGLRELMIVFSDGQPACDAEGDIYGYTKDVIKMIEDDGRVELYGIGIEDETVRNMYSRYRVVKEVAQLEQAITEVLTSHMLGELR